MSHFQEDQESQEEDEGCLDGGQSTVLAITLEGARLKTKPAAQAAGADPSRCNSTDRQNLPPSLKWPELWNQ